MRVFRAPRVTAISMFLVANLAVLPASAERLPQDWLSSMGAAVQSTSYEGTVILIQDGSAEELMVVHTVRDGVVREKMVAHEGNVLEIIRNGNVVHFILPDRQSVLVEEWDDQSTLFSTLPTSKVRFGSEYDVSIVRTGRVAGREAIELAIRPHDEFRYGHRIWLDTETSFPLQTQLIDNGQPIEQIKFADIKLNSEIHSSALEPSVSIENFTWLRQSSGHEGTRVETTWKCGALPAGFRAIDSHAEKMQGSDDVVTHILYSDGLANVSVFIAPESGGLSTGPARVGGSNSFSTASGGFEITAIGEVPSVTVKQIATSMQKP